MLIHRGLDDASELLDLLGGVMSRAPQAQPGRFEVDECDIGDGVKTLPPGGFPRLTGGVT